MASSIKDLSDRRKLALIIGNGNYHRSKNKIDSSMKNVQELSNLLKTMNFEVETILNQNKHEINTGIVDFSKKVHEGDLILLYMLGHACQVNDKNYFIPVDDVRIETSGDVEDFGVDVESKLARVVRKNSSYVTILILDCCRSYFLKGASTATCK
jgi:uncharacterized caspase-like protein